MVDENQDRKFDRLQHFDERSRAFPITASQAAVIQSVLWPCRVWLDQGREGACVGYAFSHALACAPGQRFVDGAMARGVYHDAQRIDEYPGGAYAGADPHMEGTSVLAGAKVLQERGLISAYRWAFGLEDLKAGLATGPAVLGIAWFSGMGMPDKNGFIWATGTIVGGHAICCRGYDAMRDVFTLRQSWGRAYGKDGDCFVTGSVMALLLAKGGEACFPEKIAVESIKTVHHTGGLLGRLLNRVFRRGGARRVCPC